MKQLILKIEQTSVFLSIVTITILSFNFITFNQVDERFEFGFLINSILLLFITVYLRFFVKNIITLHKVLYRISIVLLIWSTGLFFFPYMENILYLIIIPGLYFFFRVEYKKGNAEYEDIIAAGISLVFAVLIYIQHQPLKIFFYQKSFIWVSYLEKAHLLIILGPCLMRLHKQTKWRGLPIFGTTLFIIGVFFTSVLYLEQYFPYNFGSYIVIAHLMLFILLTDNVLSKKLFNLIDLTDDSELLRYKTTIYILINIFLHLNIVFNYYMYLNSTLNIYTAFTASVLCLTGLLYYRREKSVEFLIIELAIISFPVNFYITHRSHSLYLFFPLCITLLIYTVIRFKRFYKFNHISLIIVFSAYFGALFHYNFLSPLGLAGIMFPFICLFLIPDKPLLVPQKHKWLIWPILTGISVVCLTRVSYQSITIWALACITPLPLFFILINSEPFNKIITSRRWSSINTISDQSEKILFNLSIFSISLCLISFTLLNQLYVHSWIVLIQALIVIIAAISINLYFSIKKISIKYAIFAESYIWLGLLLLRWKLDVLDHLNFGSPFDGYAIILAAGIVAGIREVLRDKNPSFSKYFEKTTVIYGLIGWVYLMSLQFFFPVQGMNYHEEAASLLLAVLSFRLAKTVNKNNLIYGFIFGNIAIVMLFINQNIVNPLFYVLPVVMSGLILVQIFKDKLTEIQVKNTRLTLSLIMFGCVAFYNVNDFDQSILYPLIAAILSALGVVFGISLRVRIYLYLGTVFFFVNTIGVIAHVIIKQPPENTTLFIGIIFLVTGLTFIISFLVFQMKREEILNRYQNIKETLQAWE